MTPNPNNRNGDPAQTVADTAITEYHARERTWDAIHADLRRPLPQRLIKQKRGKGNPAYIEWETAVRLLDRYAPGWSRRVTAMVQGEGMMHVSVEITIPCKDIDVVHSSTASAFTTIVDKKIFEENRALYPTRFEGFGTPATNAEQQAFKRAASFAGIYFEPDATPQPAGHNGNGPAVAPKPDAVPSQRTPRGERYDSSVY